MFTGNDGMIELEVVVSGARILEIELNHFNAVRESIERHLGTLSDGNELFIVILDAVASEKSDGAKMSMQRFLELKIGWAETRDLHVEELGCIEYCLFILSSHLIEKIGVVGVVDQVDPAVSVFIFTHVLQNSLRTLLCSDPS